MNHIWNNNVFIKFRNDSRLVPRGWWHHHDHYLLSNLPIDN